MNCRTPGEGCCSESSADVLEQRLLENLNAVVEARRRRRVPCNTRVSVYRESEDGFLEPVCEAWATDFCVHGVGLLAERPLDTGSEYIIDFDIGPNTGCSAAIRVVRHERLAGSIHRIGAEIVE